MDNIQYIERSSELKAKMEEIRAAISNLQGQYEALEDERKKVESVLRKSVTVDKRDSTTVLTRPDGLAIVYNNDSNSHGERNVFWYNGKRGEKVISSTRASPNSLRLWLAEYAEE